MRTAKACLLFVVLLATGCGHTFYQGRLPVLERPGRPVLEDVSGEEMQKLGPQARKAVVGNFDKLIEHVEKLEVAVDTYNEYAKEQNAKFGGAAE